MDKPRNDDSALIDEAEPAVTEGGSAGGTLATDVGSRSDAETVEHPEARERVTKQDDIDQGAATDQVRSRAS